jgi:hypothetical protein
LEVCGKELRIDGRLIRIGYIDGEGYQFLEDPEAALDSVRKSRARVDLFTFVQRISDTSPKYKYPMEWDNFAVLPITTFDHWMTNQISSRVRSTIRKTSKDGLVVREVPFDDALMRGISQIYNETPVRQGRRFAHYGIDLESLRRMKATFLDRSIFIGAFFEDNLIGFVKLVMDESRTQAGTMHILSTIQHRDKAPTNALIAQAVRSCAEREIPHLWYVKFHYGKKGHDSLAEFKRRNGFQKVDIPRYYIPLTSAGEMALRFGLHHGASGWIPEPVFAAYRRMRSRWYDHKFKPGKETV